ncbi:hypothetical protein R6L23_36825, partial [Streptomyces sp. SR27]|nr:hypothetical protein [Streptomyces sp. SR27]
MPVPGAGAGPAAPFPEGFGFFVRSTFGPVVPAAGPAAVPFPPGEGAGVLPLPVVPVPRGGVVPPFPVGFGFFVRSTFGAVFPAEESPPFPVPDVPLPDPGEVPPPAFPPLPFPAAPLPVLPGEVPPPVFPVVGPFPPGEEPPVPPPFPAWPFPLLPGEEPPGPAFGVLLGLGGVGFGAGGVGAFVVVPPAFVVVLGLGLVDVPPPGLDGARVLDGDEEPPPVRPGPEPPRPPDPPPVPPDPRA